MSLYLCIFDDDDELDGVEVGAYKDFGKLRETISSVLEGGNWGARFPTLMMHSDCEGEWSVEDCLVLADELGQIISEMKNLPAIDLSPGWQMNVFKSLGVRPKNLCDSFIDVDGEPLLEKLLEMARLAKSRNLPILFQ